MYLLDIIIKKEHGLDGWLIGDFACETCQFRFSCNVCFDVSCLLIQTTTQINFWLFVHIFMIVFNTYLNRGVSIQCKT